MSKKGRFKDVTLDVTMSPPTIVYLGDLVDDDRYADLFTEYNTSSKKEEDLRDAMFDILESREGKLYEMKIGGQLENYQLEERITFVHKLLPDDLDYARLNTGFLVVQFPSSSNLWNIGIILSEGLSVLDSPAETGHKYLQFWSSHWIVGHMRFVLLRTAVCKQNIYDLMNETWTNYGYGIFYRRRNKPEDLYGQQIQARALAALIHKVSPVARSEYVDVFHVVSPNRPGLRSTYESTEAEKANPRAKPLKWHELHAFACVQYGNYIGDTDMPVVCLRLHQSVASAATFRNEQAVFVVLIDTICEQEKTDTCLPTQCKRCGTACVFEGTKKTIKFEGRKDRSTQLGSEEDVPANLTDYVAICTKCKYAHGCPTYTFTANAKP